MKCLGLALVALLVLGPTLFGDDRSGDIEPRTRGEECEAITKNHGAMTPRDQLLALCRVYDEARDGDERALREAKSDEDRQRVSKQSRVGPEHYTHLFQMLVRPYPNDPKLAEQWYLFPPDDKRGAPGSINALEAWRRIRPATPIVVALLDSGVNYTHPDLAANIWKNEREMPNGKDDDRNGYIDDLFGWDFAYNNNNPIDRRSLKFPEQFDHATALGSLMAAVPDNRIGTAGVGRNIRIMNLRVAGDPDFEGQESIPLEKTLPQAIRYGIRHGARVLVCTIGSLDPPEKHFETSLKDAEKAGVLFVKSAGNHGQNIDDDPLFQFLAQYSNVLVIGGTTREGTLSPHMNFGKRVGIAAPCVDMVFPSFDGYVRFKGPGTSFAAPIVAAAATLLSQEPDLTPAQVIARLREASVVAPGMKGKIGGGRLDMAKLFP